MISAWKSAAQRGEKRAAAEAAQRAGDLPRTLPKQKHLEFISAHNQIHKERVEQEVPYAGGVEAKLEQLESYEFIAPHLNAFACKDEGAKEERIIPQLTAAGRIVQRKYATVKVPTPANAEGLRCRIKLEATTWELARLEQATNHVIVPTSSSQTGLIIWGSYWATTFTGVPRSLPMAPSPIKRRGGGYSRLRTRYGSGLATW